MKVAVVGLGYWGPHIVRNLTHLDPCTEIVVCDLDEDRIKSIQNQYPTVVSTTDYQKVLDDPDVTAVVLATPVVTHVPLASRALEAGKNVLVEKPLAQTQAEAEALITSATDKGLLVMAGHTFLYSPPVQTIQRLISEGDIGRPLYAQSSRVNLGIHQSDVSVILDLAPHDLSILVYWLAERPASVSARGRSSHGVGPADVAFIDVDFPSGCIANLHLSWLAPTKVRRTTLVGSRRMVVYEDTDNEEPVKVYDKGVNLPDPEDYGQFRTSYRAGDVLSPRVGSWEPLRAEISDFLARVAQGETPDDREQSALWVVAALEAAETSLARGGSVVRV